MRYVIALGGNALLRRGEPPDAAAQSARIASLAPALSRLAAAHEVLIVHGNGPQIGLLSRESEMDAALSAPYPLGLLSAATQGIIGAQLQQALRRAGLGKLAVTVVTHVVVDDQDPAMRAPEKFIGSAYDRRRARDLARTQGWTVARDGDSWRRVVPSPRPKAIIELEACRSLLSAGVTVIAGGGGGIPMTPSGSGGRLLEAVVDKDRTAALLAQELDADKLVILTDVPGVIVGYGTPQASVLTDTTPELARALGLPAGSMGAKVDAAGEFVTAMGRPAVIGPVDHAEDVVAGILGTRVSAGEVSPRSSMTVHDVDGAVGGSRP